MDNVQVEKNLKHRLKYIKKTLKEKIAIYKPLDYITAYNRFIQWIQDGYINNIEEITENCEAEGYIEVLIKNFLTREAYYALGEKYLRQCFQGYLLLFDRSQKASWKEKIFKLEKTFKGKRIPVFGM